MTPNIRAVLMDLAAARNPYRVRALAELAKHYEHNERSYSMALEMTRAALALEDSAELRRREERLKSRLARPRGGVALERQRQSMRKR